MEPKPTPPPLVVWVDTREQLPFEPIPGVVLERVTLPTGDYTTELLQLAGVLERKSVQDFSASITRSRERFDDEIRRMREYRWRAIIVEGSIGDVWRDTSVHPHSIIGSVASFFARHEVPCLFADTRLSAARLTFGILRRWQERLLAEKAK